MSQEAGVICVVTRPTTTSKDLEAFRQEVQEAHKARREFLGIENISVLSHEHYVALEETSQACLDLYEVDTVGPLLEGLSLLEQGGQGPLVTASYIYKIQSTHGLTPGHSSETPGLLVQVSMEPPMTHLDGFNKWYEEEHVPMLSKVPGWLSTVRAKKMLASGEADASLPRYASFHRYAPGNGCGTSAEWQASTSTPWATRVKEAVDREGSRARSQWTFVPTH